uniref:very-long-chain enoyl-CoA reductase n=1 Tax=Plectus sambesii TaxID=2011161 RepID=A0A914V456_9BILA
MASLKVEIVDAKTQRIVTTLENISPEDTVFNLKYAIHQQKSKLYPDRQALRLEPKGKALKEEQRVKELNLPTKGAQLYFRDLGPQIGWQTVFLIEYAGPLFIYPLFWLRPSIIYGSKASEPMAQVVNIACLAWSFHYAKRLFETVFIHRFSHGTMPQFNVVKNSSYYWGFCAFVSYFVNHPLYTPPAFGAVQVYAGLAGFILAELGNYSIHLLFRNLRPAGSKERKIPVPNGNPFTQLFNFVSCPNYTYEVAAWLSFSIMTQSLPALLFTIAGFVQMAIWAKGKHRNYKKEFSNYPKGRTAIIPFLL